MVITTYAVFLKYLTKLNNLITKLRFATAKPRTVTRPSGCSGPRDNPRLPSKAPSKLMANTVSSSP